MSLAYDYQHHVRRVRGRLRRRILPLWGASRMLCRRRLEPSKWRSRCAISHLTMTDDEWQPLEEQVYAMYENYEDLYPKTVILGHGTALRMGWPSYKNLAETLTQRSSVLDAYLLDSRHHGHSWLQIIHSTIVYSDGSRLLG
jgi:hypothetical protein